MRFISTRAPRSLCLGLLAAITISACSGWQLRGSDNRANIAANIALQGMRNDTYLHLSRQLQKQGYLSGVQQADYLLQLKAEQWQSRSLSVNIDGTTAEHQLSLTLPYRLADTKGNALTSQQVRINRSYTAAQGDIVGKEKAAALVRQEIRAAAAQQILQRLPLLLRAE